MVACAAPRDPAGARPIRSLEQASAPRAAASPSPADATPTQTADTAAEPATPEAGAAWPPNALPTRTADWCTGDLRALDDETCFFLPEAPTTELVLYLHGIVPPSGESVQKTALARVVSSSARRAGVAALLPRGEQGYGPKGVERWWSWPTSRSLHVARGQSFVKKVRAKRAAFEAATGIAFRRVYVAGSSAGAWFAAGIALHGDLDADGFGAFSGGAGYATAALATLPPRPFYVGFGKYDSVGDGARALARLLERAGWPVRVAEHPTGHGSREIYLDEAIEFWRTAAATADSRDGAARD